LPVHCAVSVIDDRWRVRATPTPTSTSPGVSQPRNVFPFNVGVGSVSAGLPHKKSSLTGIVLAEPPPTVTDRHGIER